jgi:hypothetical protein
MLPFGFAFVFPAEAEIGVRGMEAGFCGVVVVVVVLRRVWASFGFGFVLGFALGFVVRGAIVCVCVCVVCNVVDFGIL